MLPTVLRAPRPALLIVCLATALAATTAGSAADGSCPPDGSTCATTTETTAPTTTAPTTTETTTTETTPTTTTTETGTTPTDTTETGPSPYGDDLIPQHPGSGQSVQAPKPAAAPQKPTPAAPAPVVPPTSGPQLATPVLGGGPYVFPVYGPVEFTDTFGAARADVSWHHGDDIFAPLGSPILAVAEGTVFSVGWNSIGGNRLWLRDREGNYFYYAHLAAFSTLAVEGARVHAGDVLGFVGNTGDAAGTPYHLHFEIHPVALLGLGYDGAVDPTSYLRHWQRAGDLASAAPIGVGWSRRSAPTAGAILLASSDISSANGLEPGSLARALTAKAVESAAAIPVSAAPVGPQEPGRPVTAVRDFDGTLPSGMLAAAPWDLVANCESRGKWNEDTGNGFFGGLQFEPGTWRAFGGEAFARSAHQATREQQIVVAQRVLASQGWLAWPACSAKLGFR
jgi:murein DD-endopeptidase MepM/ murein hydrolase activator NlpD